MRQRAGRDTELNKHRSQDDLDGKYRPTVKLKRKKIALYVDVF